MVASDELAQHYADPPDGIRVNMIMSIDGATAFDGLAGPLSGLRRPDGQLSELFAVVHVLV